MMHKLASQQPQKIQIDLPPKRNSENRFALLIPVSIFLVIVVLLGFGLTMDPRLVPSPLIDKSVPKFSLSPVQGRVLGLASSDLKQKVSLVNVFASWCVACREEMPALDRLQAKLGGPDFEVVALSIDRGQSIIIEKFYQELELKSLAIYHDPTGGASYKLNVPGIPATFLVNREGKGIGYVVGPIEWDSPEIVNEIKSYLSRDKEEKDL